MKVAQKDVLNLFTALGFKNCEKWSGVKIADKLKGLAKIVDEDTETDDKKANKLLKALLAALKKKEKIVMTSDEDEDEDEDEGDEDEKPAKGKKGAKAKGKKDEDDEEEEESEDEDEEPEEEEEESDDEEEEEEEEEEKSTKKKKGAKAKGKKDDDDEEEEEEESEDEDDDEESPKKNKKGKKSKGEKAEKDPFGIRMGTRSARINSVMKREPQSVKEIAKRAKAESISSHLLRMVKEGYFEKTDDHRYRLAKKYAKYEK